MTTAIDPVQQLLDLAEELRIKHMPDRAIEGHPWEELSITKLERAIEADPDTFLQPFAERLFKEATGRAPEDDEQPIVKVFRDGLRPRTVAKSVFDAEMEIATARGEEFLAELGRRAAGAQA